MNISNSMPTKNPAIEAILESLRGQAPALVRATIPVIAPAVFDALRTYAERKGYRLPDGALADLARQFDVCRLTAWFTKSAVDVKVDTRKPIPRPLRVEIVKSQNWKCHYGWGRLKKSRFSPGSYWEIDHKVPVSKGGSDDRSNLVAACRKHNRAKGVDDYFAFWIRRVVDPSLWQCGH